MTKPNQDATQQAATDAVLVGGPDDLPEVARHASAGDDTTIKVLHRGGYEHFERDEGLGGREPSGPPVYRWTMRTRIAE
ncbi:DUF5988 family protein [Actinomadura oligospora]|uniref:DUF5988 family protein n=1 Tax=Actinomadura oligospora TaxID=111804 RepID=UPI00047BF6A6|nr:DUF5988 family protein [Actinomadura oligospora]